MRKPILQFFQLCFLVLVCKTSFAQEWKDVAPIIYKHCSSCHRPGEIGQGYLNAMGYSLFINSPYFYNIPPYVSSKLMPPWRADPNYHHYLDERILTNDEINMIDSFVYRVAAGNYVPGDTTLAPDPPIYPEGSQLGTPDLVLTMSEPHTLAGNGIDDYVCFVLPTNLLQDKDISAIEFRPGNGVVVHHVFMYLVTDSSAVYADQQTPEYGYPSFGGAGPSVHANFLGLYGPGMVPRYFPANGVMNFPAGSFFLIQVHYAPMYYVTTDQSSVNLFFSNYSSPRTAKATRLGEAYITNPPFKIEANKIDTFYSKFTVVDEYSLFAIAPHQHLLGKSYKIFAVTPSDDTLPLIYIPQWDFHWQMLYSFPFLIHLETGTVVNAVAVYDNTTNNPWNPNNPPQEVHYGENSTDEMFKYLICTLAYEPGDEDIVIDSAYLTGDAPPMEGIVSTPQLYSCYPNPANDKMTVSYYLPSASMATLSVYDQLGRVMMQREISNQSGLQHFDLDVSSMVAGTYFVSLKSEERILTKSFLVER